MHQHYNAQCEKWLYINFENITFNSAIKLLLYLRLCDYYVIRLALSDRKWAYIIKYPIHYDKMDIK